MPTIDVNGLRMYYELEGTGAPLVLISGLSGDHFAWGMQVPAFVAAGYQCLVFDSRDAGQTDESTVASYAIRQFADDTVGLMEKLGIQSAHILGASMGGAIGQEIAINYPERVLSLTLVCTTPVIDSWIGGIIRSWKTLRPAGSVEDFLRTICPSLFTYRFFEQAEPLPAFLQMVHDTPFPQTPARFARQCDALLTHDCRDRLARVTAPTHVIVGAEDTLTPMRYSRALASGISGARLTELPACGHGLFWEKPGEFAQAVLGFLKTSFEEERRQ